MATVKTAISLEANVLKIANELAANMRISRSKLIANAIKAYAKQQKKQKLVDEINAFYAEGPDEEELATLAAMKETMSNLLEPEEW